MSFVAASHETEKGLLVSPYCRSSDVIGENFASFNLLCIALSSAISFAIAFAVYSVMKRSQVIINSVKKKNNTSTFFLLF